MSATTIAISSPINTLRRGRDRVVFFDRDVLSFRRSSAVGQISFGRRYGCRALKKTTRFFKPFSTVMEWQDCTVKMEVGLPASVAYNCYSDREAFPQWMPFISTVKILEDKPDLSRWTLKYGAFGRDLEFSFLARNMQPIPNQKIHWRSLDGLPNRGAVRFFPKGPSSCVIECHCMNPSLGSTCPVNVVGVHLDQVGRFPLTVSYEVPQLLIPVASALQPLLKSLLSRGLERFVNFAKSYSSDSTS